jgi:hypothetical protein
MDMSTTTETADLGRFLKPVTDIPTPELTQGIADMRADPQFPVRLDELASKTNNGQWTDAEQPSSDDGWLPSGN